MSLYPKPIEEYLALIGIPRGKDSQVYFVDAANGSDAAAGTSFRTPLATIAEAEDRCVANQHDVVMVLSGSSGNTLSAGLTWDKSYTHLIGLCAPTRVGQRARIFSAAGDNGISPLINVTASGCIMRDLYVFHGVDDAHALINVQVTGGRNYFENVHFAGAGHASNAVDGAASLKLDGAEENTFVKCTFGVDTVGAAAGVDCVLFDSEAHRNVFEDCNFTLWASNGAAAFVEVADATGMDRYNIFKNCLFLNTGSTLASSIVLPAAMTSTRKIFLFNCMSYGATTWDANDRTGVYGNMNAVTGADLSGVAVQMIS